MTEEMYQMLHRMLAERRDYYAGCTDASRNEVGRVTDDRALGEYMAYSSALSMLEYAHDDNYECLSQYDSYGE